MNKTHLQARQKANKELGIYISNRMDELKAKGYSNKQIEAKFQHQINDWLAEQETLDYYSGRQEAIDNDRKFNLMRNTSGDAGNMPNPPRADGRRLGRDACPLAFRTEDMQAVHKAMQSGQNIRIWRTSGLSLSGLLRRK